MMKTEAFPTVPPLTRFAWATATLAGVGAALGLGLGTLQLGRRMPEFVATNAMSLSARMTLLKWFFLPLVVLPVVLGVCVIVRANDPARLQTFERWASRLAPLCAIGLWPMLLNGDLWKGRTLLFLTATLTSTLLVWGALRHFQGGGVRGDLRLILQAFPRRWFDRCSVWLPWAVLLTVAAVMLVHGLADTEFAGARAYRGGPVLSVGAAFRQMGHGGVLALPFVLYAKLRQPSAFNTFVVLSLVFGAALPLYAWAKSRISTLPALLVALAYLSFPSLLTAGVAQALPLGAAAVFFFVAITAWEKQRYVVATVSAVLMLSVHEQTAFWFVVMGVYLAQRGRPLRLFPVVAFVLLVYFTWVAAQLLPSFGFDPYGERFHGLWSVNTPGLLPAFRTVFDNPVHALMKLAEQRDITVWLLLIVPFGLLPLRDKRWVLWVLPFTLFGLVALGHPPDASMTHPSIAHFIVLGFVAAVSALESIRQGETGNARVWAALLTWTFALVPCVHQLGCAWLPPL